MNGGAPRGGVAADIKGRGGAGGQTAQGEGAKTSARKKSDGVVKRGEQRRAMAEADVYTKNTSHKITFSPTCSTRSLRERLYLGRKSGIL